MSGKAGRALSVYEPERFPVSARQTVIKMISLWATAFPVGGHCRAAFQSAHVQGVRVPESFQGGCSFGGHRTNTW